MLRIPALPCLLPLLALPATAQTELFTVEGSAPGDFFGSSMRTVGDVNGDGQLDFLVPVVGTQRQVRVYSGSDQQILYTLTGTDGGFGRSIDGIGDLDGDGMDDFAISQVPSGAVVNLGVVFVYSGATGDVLYSLDALGAGADIFGQVLRSCADIDGDGRRDLLVLSVRLSTGTDQSVIGYSGATGTELFRVEGPSGSSSVFADAIASLGDITGDGVGDFALSDANYFSFGGGGAQVRGRTLVYSGANRTVVYEVFGNNLTFNWAETMENAGDIDGDGLDDLLIGSEEAGSGGFVQVISGSTGAEIYRVDPPEESNDYGTALAGIGDADGDGRDDFAVGDRDDIPFVVNAGSAYVYSGATGEELFRVTGEVINTNLGASVAPAGDVDGNGLNDLLVGVPQNNPGTQDPGRVVCYGFGVPSVRIDFELDDDFQSALGNGDQVDLGLRFGNLLKFSVSGPAPVGAAVFDSSPSGPNGTGPAPGLLVDQGNLVVLQATPAQTIAGTYDIPEPAAGGTLRIDLVSPATLQSVDLVALSSPEQGAMVRVIDIAGRVRTYEVPGGFTSDATVAPDLAVQTLDLTVLDPQVGVSATAIATENEDFDAARATAIEFVFASTGAIDGLVLVPSGEPASVQIERLYSIPEPPQANSFGVDLRGVGDLDGDGCGDFVIGSAAEGSVGLGVARVYSGKTGALLASIEGSQPVSAFGQATCGIGDVSGDGIPDLAVGAWLYDTAAGFSAGAARVYSGSDSQLLYEVFGQPGDNLGVDIDVLADRNGDGFAEWAVGAPGADGFLGRIEIRSGSDGQVLLAIPGSMPNGRLGTLVRNAGDFDGDGLDDVVAYEEGGSPVSFAGRFAVYSGADGSVLVERIGTQNMQFLGAGSSGAGDVNGDGFDDVLFADRNYIDPGTGTRGRLQVLAGPDGAVIHELLGETSFSSLPIWTAAVGDQDGDGRPDFAAVEDFDPAGPAPSARRIRVYSGKTAAPLFDRFLETPDLYGQLAPAGDLNGDGFEEMLAIARLDFDFEVEVLSVVRASASVICSGAPNSTGIGSRIYTNGKFGAQDNALQLTATNLPPRSLTLLVSSPAFGFTPMPGIGSNPSAGALCIDGGPIVRHSFAGLGANFSATFDVDLTLLPGARPTLANLTGTTQFFQCVYRDLGSPGSTNLSDAIAIRFE